VLAPGAAEELHDLATAEGLARGPEHFDPVTRASGGVNALTAGHGGIEGDHEARHIGERAENSAGFYLRSFQRRMPVCPIEYRPGCGQTAMPCGPLPTRILCSSLPVRVLIP
jgi:hypothetical protein